MDVYNILFIVNEPACLVDQPQVLIDLVTHAVLQEDGLVVRIVVEVPEAVRSIEVMALDPVRNREFVVLAPGAYKIIQLEDHLLVLR